MEVETEVVAELEVVAVVTGTNGACLLFRSKLAAGACFSAPYPSFLGASYLVVHHSCKLKCGGRDLNSRVTLMTSRVSSVAGYCPGPG